MLVGLGLRSFTRMRYPRTLDHGTETIDLTADPTSAVVWGIIQPMQGQSDQINRDGDAYSKVVWLQPGSDVKADDHIQLADGLYFVDGAPETWDATGTSLDHMMVRLNRWEG